MAERLLIDQSTRFSQELRDRSMPTGARHHRRRGGKKARVNGFHRKSADRK